MVWMAACLFGAANAKSAAVENAEPAAAVAPESGADEARAVAHWVRDSGDNRGLPYAIVDKKQARLLVFGGDGRLIGDSAALLGLAPGDHALPGTGAKPPADILPAERTTPAGRFATEPGRNLDGEPVVWFDYEAGLAIHRVRPGASEERRLERLESLSPADNRISLGCVVVAESFYLGVVEPLLGRSRGVVYVLPETRPVAEVFGGWRVGSSQRVNRP